MYVLMLMLSIEYFVSVLVKVEVHMLPHEDTHEVGVIDVEVAIGDEK